MGFVGCTTTINKVLYQNKKRPLPTMAWGAFYSERTLSIQEAYKMAKRSMDTDGPSHGRKPRKEEPEAVKFRYAPIELNASDKDTVKSEPLDWGEIGEVISGMVFAGYKVSFNYELKSDCVLVAFTSQDESRPDFNRCVTSRASDFRLAMSLAEYRYRVYCQDGIPAPSDHSQSEI